MKHTNLAEGDLQQSTEEVQEPRDTVPLRFLLDEAELVLSRIGRRIFLGEPLLDFNFVVK